ncbi:glycoside hydrolase family 43 protein [soil metagenome]
MPNPFVLVEDDRYVLYASQIGIYDPTIQVRTSDTLDQWGPPTDAMPQVPAWVAAGFTWAPDVRRVGDTYAMWFTARVKALEDPPTQCIGVAFADDALGPFVGDPEPLVCQLDRRGSIDPRSFAAEDGTLWLHWKSDDNADVDGTTTSSIYAQRLSVDARRLIGDPTRILEVDQPWEGRIVEAPHMLRRPDGRHWLWYSGNWFNQAAYGIGVAECEGPAGPCRKPFDGPWLASNAQGDGPGESSHVVDHEGRVWILYSPLAQQFETTTKRPVAMARVGFDERGPYLAAAD